jgi:hypothetical protein
MPTIKTNTRARRHGQANEAHIPDRSRIACESAAQAIAWHAAPLGNRLLVMMSPEQRNALLLDQAENARDIAARIPITMVRNDGSWTRFGGIALRYANARGGRHAS